MYVLFLLKFIVGSCHCVNVKGSFGSGSPDLVSIETLGELGQSTLSMESSYGIYCMFVIFIK